MNQTSQGQTVPQRRLGRNTRLLGSAGQPMLPLALLGLAGIAVDRSLAIPSSGWLIASALALIVAVAFKRRGEYRRWAIAMFLLSACGYGHHCRFNDYPADTLAGFMDYQYRPMIVRGVVCSPVEYRRDNLALHRGKPEDRAWQSVFEIQAQSISDSLHAKPASGLARVTVYGAIDSLLCGDLVELACHGQRISQPTNPGEIDFQKMYRFQRQAVRLRCDHPEQVKRISAGRLSLARVINLVGDQGYDAIEQHLSAPNAALAQALVLGRRESVDRTLKDRLLETGTIHLLAVSGLHVGIVALAVGWLAMAVGFSRTGVIVWVIGLTLAYMLVTGARAPVVRASILVVIVLVGRFVGRRSHPLNALATAAVLLIVVDPLCVNQIGTQLSFLAVASIAWITWTMRPVGVDDPLEKLLRQSQGRFQRGLRSIGSAVYQSLVLSFWISALAMPLVWYHFHIVSPISILANVLLWIPLTVALISGMATAIIGSVAPWLASIPAYLCDGALSLIVTLVDRLAQVRWGHFWLPSPPWEMIGLFYAMVILIPLMIRTSRLRPVLASAIGLWAAVAAMWTTAAQRHDSLIATFIDVGHGTSVLLQMPDGQNWLYDAGRLGDPTFARWPIESVLWSAGIYRLDTVIVSHADADHYNAIVGLSERFTIGRTLAAWDMFPGKQRGVQELYDRLRRMRVPIESIAAGEVLYQSERLRVGVMHPPKQRLQATDNANSVVLRIDAYGKCLILPGDLEPPGTAMLIAQDRPPPGGVLMAPHHGSLSQDMYPVLQWAQPRIVIASGGQRASKPLVIQALEETGAQAFVTARDGAIRVTMDAGGIQIRAYQSDPW